MFPIIDTLLDVWMKHKGHIQKRTFWKRRQYYSWLLYFKKAVFFNILEKKNS